jgi:aldehyde:ferredoxin oxidoreductase
MKNAVLERTGREILILKNKFKVREGFKPAELRIPSRIFETPSARGVISKSDIKQAVQRYFELLNSKES